MKAWIAAALLILGGTFASGHRLDEYLQGTLLSVEKSKLKAEMTLTPGVAIFPILIGEIDTDGDGVISPAEQRAYAARVLGDLTLSIDGYRLAPQLRSAQFPSMDEMREGRGEIRLAFDAALPPGGRNRRVTLENRHQVRMAAYQVNCLVPGDPKIRIMEQKRNYTQSHYELEYEQMDAVSASPLWLSGLGLLLCARFGLLWRGGRLRRLEAQEYTPAGRIPSPTISN